MLKHKWKHEPNANYNFVLSSELVNDEIAPFLTFTACVLLLFRLVVIRVRSMNVRYTFNHVRIIRISYSHSYTSKNLKGFFFCFGRVYIQTDDDCWYEHVGSAVYLNCNWVRLFGELCKYVRTNWKYRHLFRNRKSK